MPPHGYTESTPCASLTTVAGIGLVACSLDGGHDRDRPHQEIDESTGQILTQWPSRSSQFKQPNFSDLQHVA
ncbi:hypothetical protein CH306_27625 [Rhodococcus sp. 15-725-2-2b]|nr:hypothetical protein A2J02_25055 [Rhodococcus sp. EPR-147]KZF05896.1 hypothetical protein A2J04_24610 [Rhodococcus sp. EPR-279]OZC60494.1 hypothetical protein CH277_27485 [Rhodococcus sp. 06-469-3-2]OZD40982.1 hypothetical protein CH264_25435 [Rhodococcus sp. 06-1477-1A]OZE01672.1 hypothetical protein CH250_26785 [Rhodococcus sp. 05-2255-3C]OZE07298.1 hypothetical protein CH249_19385 [Rhodococcus sp. 05-2255-3B1]OZE17195.1 hypothetical protein CH255_19150 [Rhodococcus sp. 05-2255-2A2]OZE6